MKGIPQIDKRYWLLMILATTIGEIVGNLISRNLGLGYSNGSILLISIYLLALTAIAFSKGENPVFYWLLIIFGNIAGTNIADFVTIQPLNLGTIWGSLLVMGMLVLILIIWRIVAPNSSLDKGFSKTAVFLYWFAILMSSTFGTTSGDYLSNDTPLGALGGSILLLALLGIIILAVLYTKISKELCYWIALVLMHPVGATIGNYISKPAGLNFGNVWTSVVLIAMFLLIFLSGKLVSRRV
ncbi:hypothetical protein BH09BAC5_BH09BAC5_18690 [soil metagenome]